VLAANKTEVEASVATSLLMSACITAFVRARLAMATLRLARFGGVKSGPQAWK
jgi:hypothetical protein